jgi:tetratricopeptide (TPR) repeat protein
MTPGDLAALRRRDGLGRLAVLAALAAMLAASARLSDRFDARRRAAPRDRILYLPRGDSLQYMSLGYRGIAADMVWMRGVLYLGGKLRHEDTNYEWLSRLYEVTSDLDPHWTVPYRAGAMLLSALPQDDERALALLRRGIERNPDNWNIPYVAAQLHLLRGQTKEALKYLRLIDRLPDRPGFIPGLIMALQAEGNDHRSALRTAATGLSDTDDRVYRHVLAAGYREVLARLLAHELTAATRDFTGSRGRAPRDLRELLEASGASAALAGRLAPWLGPDGYPDLRIAELTVLRLPADPLGMEFHLRPDGTVHSQGVERLELLRLIKMLNSYLGNFRKKSGRPPDDIAEFLAYLRSARMGEGARAVFGNPARLPEHPMGPDTWTGNSACSWAAMLDRTSGLLVMPPGPEAAAMFAAPLELPPGPAARRAAGTP